MYSTAFIITAVGIVFIFIIGIGILAFQKYQTNIAALEDREKEMDRRMYELAILKELGERIGYSLDIQQIIDIITGSLHQFIEYSVASYMILEPEKIVFKVHLEQSVPRKFVDEVRDRMLGSLSALLDREFEIDQIEEIISGAIIDEEGGSPVKSYFNIPLVIGENVVGVLTVAHKQAGLYQDEEMTILYKITQQASQAVTKLQEVVETEQRKLNSMVQSMTEGVIMTDTDYRVVVINPVVKQALGLEDKKGVTIFDLISKLGGTFEIREKLAESIKLEKTITIPEVLLNERFYKVMVAPVKANVGLNTGEVLGGVVIFHDITHDKELERMREDFSAMMVHELRSPLGNIRRLSEYLQDDNAEINEETNDKYLGLIFSNATQMLELVNDLLDVAKIEAGEFEIEKQPTDIRHTFDDRIAFYQKMADEKNIQLSTVVAEGVTDAVPYDEQRISQTINNYLSNAIKFTPEGGNITLQALFHKADSVVEDEATSNGIDWFISNEDFSNDKNQLIVAVTDSGAGIPQEKIDTLFSKFKQIRSLADAAKEKGTGLGLAIVKGIISAHGGAVGVASQVDKGSTFYFTIPVGEDK